MNDDGMIDDAVFDDLVEQIGIDAVRSIVEIFLQECRELRDTIAAPGRPEGAARAAHSLKSSAGQLGARALSQAALAVESAAGDGSPELPRHVAALTGCAEKTETALLQRIA